MKWSWRLGSISGIGIFMHWTFLLLIAWILFAHLGRGDDMGKTLEGAGFILAIFACVILHELGHALAARRYGIPTRDITLLPIGGVARLERMPEEPSQELRVALAGPLTSLAVAALLFSAANLIAGLDGLYKVKLVGGPLLVKLMWVNVALTVFNLLPAFPMDGGRVLRALLATRMDYVRATQVAASVGQVMAIAFGFLGFFFNWFLIFIALFVYLGAQEEAHMVQVKSIFRGVPVREAMITHFRTLEEEDPISEAVRELISGDQQDFPVMRGGQVSGILTRRDLVQALAEGRQAEPVGEVMRPPCGTVDEKDMLESTFQRMQEAGCSAMPVVRGDHIVGIVNLENVGEWLMVHSALRHAKARSDIEDIFRLGDRVTGTV